jgi:phosphoribosylaminoimidazole-succinocarboxamide synthase
MDDHMYRADTEEFYEAKEALRQALVDADDTSQERVDEKAKREHEWAGLTDEEIQDLSYLSQKIDESNAAWFDRWGFARAIEAKLREKNKW